MAQSNTDQGIDGMEESDLRTAYRLGARIAEVALVVNSSTVLKRGED